MLLAAGWGTRLMPFTVDRPKPMVPVGGVPILERNVRWLREEGVTDFIVNLHHHPEAVTTYFRDGSAFGVRMGYSPEPALLGTGGALDAARAQLEGSRFLVMYADNLIRCDLSRLLAGHIRRRAALTMLVHWRDDPASSGVVDLGPGDRVLAVREKPGAGSPPAWVNGGLLVCEPSILYFVPRSRPSDLSAEVIPLLLKGGSAVFAERLRPGETIAWVDTPVDLARVSAALGRESN